MKKILLYLNTSYHVETTLSLYKTLLKLNYKPIVLLGFQKHERQELNLENTLRLLKIKYFWKEQFNDKLLDYIDFTIIVTAWIKNPLNDFKPPHYNDLMVKLSHKKILLLYHSANYLEIYNNVKHLFINSIACSVSQFSQRYNLEYINIIENPICDIIKPKKYLNKDYIKCLVLGRFDLNNRNLNFVDKINEVSHGLNKKVEIIFMGENLTGSNKFLQKLLIPKSQNLKFSYLFNVEEILYYKNINNSDYIINCIDNDIYYKEKFTSNILHILNFEKPSFSKIPLGWIYNIPTENFDNNFEEIFIETINNETDESYEKKCNSFTSLKNNLRKHNEIQFKKFIDTD